MKITAARMIGVGGYLPEKILTNEDLSKIVDTSDEWITERTGIKERHVAADNELTSDLATIAAKRALEDAGVSASEIDLIILATTTPDMFMPATAVKVQRNLGNITGAAFDIQAVCSGFVYAMHTANAIIRSGGAKKVLVIGAETLSRIVDWNDRNTCVLFGDGAGAVVLSAVECEDDPKTMRGIISSKIHSDGNFIDILHVKKGVSSKHENGYIYMEGREVFKHAVTKITACAQEVMNEAGVSTSDLDLFVPHQANARIITAVGERLGLPENKVMLTVGMQGNTSAATIPLSLDIAKKEGKLKDNSLILMDALGAGLTWGSLLIRL